jgi:7-cyano-7-deazaguanosine (preQ0) biosynthesis protein QueE
MGETLVVSEVFGPTIQGEGPSGGRRAGFVRLGRCNLSCTWCDSEFSWNWERYDPAAELSVRAVDDVLSELDAMSVAMVVLTGGEPLLQQHGLVRLLEGTKERGWRVEVETNGTIAPAVANGLVDQWNVSPKLANSGLELGRRYRPEVLRAFEATGCAVFKFVATSPADLDEVQAMVDECGLTDIWVMPEGTDAGTVTSGLVSLGPSVVARGWNLSSRLHILIWGDRRGV